jgi:DNA-binding XRE family transcriptional regulator
MCHIVNLIHTIDGHVHAIDTAILDRVPIACEHAAMITIDMLLGRGQARRRLPLARVIREQAGVSQAELAAILGVDRSAISRWEAGIRIPRSGVIGRYADLLDRLAQQE